MLALLGVASSLLLGQAPVFPAFILEASWSCGRTAVSSEVVTTPDTTPLLEVPEGCGGPRRAELRIVCAERCTGWIEAERTRVAALSLERPDRIFTATSPLPVVVTPVAQKARWLRRLKLSATPVKKLVVERPEPEEGGPIELRLAGRSHASVHVLAPGQPVSLTPDARVAATVELLDEARAEVTLWRAGEPRPHLRITLPVSGGEATVPCAQVGWSCAGDVSLRLRRAPARTVPVK